MKNILCYFLLLISPAVAKWRTDHLGEYFDYKNGWRYYLVEDNFVYSEDSWDGTIWSQEHQSHMWVDPSFDGAIMIPEGNYNENGILPPPQIILDTDLNWDSDDIYALAMLHRLQDQGKCRLLGVVCSDISDSAYAADAVNHFYGRGDLPIGAADLNRHREDNPARVFGILEGKSAYVDALRDYPHDLKTPLGASSAYTKMLKSTRQRAKVCIVGYATAMAEFLESGAKEVDRVEAIYWTASHPDIFENNIRWWPGTAERVMRDFPGDIYVCGVEIGIDERLRTAGKITSPSTSPIKRLSGSHILRKGYTVWWQERGMPFGAGNASADQVAIWAAVDNWPFESSMQSFKDGEVTFGGASAGPRYRAIMPSNPSKIRDTWDNLVFPKK